MSRTAHIQRKSAETIIDIDLDLDGVGAHNIETPVPFLSHMLAQIARHGCMDLNISASGDTEIDDHHTVEDVAMCLGSAVRQALGDRKGIERFGNMKAPLDEALVEVTIDLSGRPYLVFELDLPLAQIGTFDVSLVKEFYQALAVKAECNLHVRKISGQNLHHIVEASFKALALALRQATRITRPLDMVPSTKEILD